MLTDSEKIIKDALDSLSTEWLVNLTAMNTIESLYALLKSEIGARILRENV